MHKFTITSLIWLRQWPRHCSGYVSRWSKAWLDLCFYSFSQFLVRVGIFLFMLCQTSLTTLFFQPLSPYASKKHRWHYFQPALDINHRQSLAFLFLTHLLSIYLWTVHYFLCNSSNIRTNYLKFILLKTLRHWHLQLNTLECNFPLKKL